MFAPINHARKKLKSRLRTDFPADNHLPTGSGEGGNEAKVLIMDVGFTVEPCWALRSKQGKPACQNNLYGCTVNDSGITTASHSACYCSLFWI